MADNLNVSAGSGATIGMDEVVDGTLGTVKVGFGKIMDGTLDSTNKLVVDSTGALSSNQTRINSTTVDTNSGVKSAGTQRFVIATDQPQLTNAFKVDGSAVTQPVSAASLPLPALAATSTKQSDGTQKTQIVDGSGAVIASAQAGTGVNNLSVIPSGQVFAFSTANSTTAQLAASATFTGTVESVVSQQSFSVLVFSDQPGTLTINQYTDAAGLKLNQTLTFTNTAGVGLARSGALNGNYIKITYQNTGGSTTTTLQIDTAFGTIPSATQLNNSPSAINEINGTTVDSNSGNKSAGTMRMVLATDQPAMTNAQPANITQVNSTAISATNPLPSTNSDGTNTANVLKSDSTSAGQNALLAATAVQQFSFTTSAAGAQTLLANTYVGNFAWIEIVYTSVGVGLALTGQYSATSGGTYVNLSTFGSGVSAPNAALGATVSTVYNGPIKGNYFQIAVSALTSGTFAGTVTLRTISPTGASVAQSGTWNVGASTATGSAVPANAFAMGMSDGTNLRMAVGNATDGMQMFVKATASDNGLTKTKTICAASTNPVSIKGSAGKIYTLEVTNADTVGYFVKLYNKATAPTVGTDVPVAVYFAPPGSGFVLEKVIGSYFSTGIALGTSLLGTDADTTVVTTANKVIINTEWV